MDAGAPKDITIICENCKSEKIMKAHWKNSVIYSKCEKCGRNYRYELENWKQKLKQNL